MDFFTADELRQYLETSRIGLWKIEMEEGEVVRMYMDSEMLSLSGLPEGLSPEENNIQFKKHIHPDDASLMKEYDAELLQGGAEVMYRYIHPVFGEMLVRCMGRRISSDGKIVTIIGQHQDCSEIVRLERGIQREKQLLRRNRYLLAQQLVTADYYKNLLDMENCGILAYTVPGQKIQHMNAEALRIFDVKDIAEAQVHLGDILHNIIYPDSCTVEKLTALRKNSGIVDFECTVAAKNGQVTNVIARTEVFITPKGERSVVTTFVDISENKALKREKSILAAMSIDYTCIFYCELENDLISPIKQDDNAITKLIRQQIPEDNNSYSLIIRYFYEHYVIKESAPDFIQKMKASYLKKYFAKNRRFAYRLQTLPDPEGHEFFELQMVRLENTDGLCVVMGFRYIDDIVAEQEEQRIQLEKANRAKTTFLLNMSHDIRTPMNAILGFARLMRDKSSDPELIHYQEMIEKSGEILLSIVNNVLDMARIESGKVELDENCSATGDIISAVYKVFEAVAKKKNIEMIHKVNVIHPYIMCDITKIQEIFTNLISNAVKYTPSGGKITVTTEELPCEKKGYAVFRTVVEDTGIGMSKEYIPMIFDAFSRERNTTAGKIHGTGLGMTIVKSLVDLMNGSIEVESEIGKGTKFTVTIAHKIVGKKFYENLKIPPEEENVDFSGKKILLAEDNALNAEIATSILKKMGFSVELAEDGIVCVEKIENEKNGYDFILMDIQMPNMDGYKATRLIRQLSDKKKAEIPIIAMTANAFDEDRKKAFEVGMNGYVSKPVDAKSLKKTLASIVLGTQAFDERTI